MKYIKKFCLLATTGIFALAAAASSSVEAQGGRPNSASKAAPVRLSNLLSDGAASGCKNIRRPVVGRIVGRVLLEMYGTVTGITVRAPKGAREYIVLDEARVESLGEAEARRRSALLVKGRKVEARVIECPHGDADLYYATSITVF